MRKQQTNPLTGNSATRRKRNMPPQSARNGDGTVVKYKAIGSTVSVPVGSPGAAAWRPYVPGAGFGVLFLPGPNIVAQYATGLFKPGTSISWEPSVSPIVGGRAFVAFTDNPEVMESLLNKWSTFNSSPGETNYLAYANAVKALANVTSWPVWQEHSLIVPQRLRRKRFDCQKTITYTDVNQLDRSAQVMMFAAFDGFDTTSFDPDVPKALGSFWYHDVVDVEGMHSEIV